MIGAGAAGLMAAYRAARRGGRILLVEKANKVGVKILMSGGTRCNVTHDTNADGIMAAFGGNGSFLRQVLAAFGPRDVREMLRENGVPTQVEETGKVFPTSNRAIDVRDALLRQAIVAGVEIRCGTAVRDITRIESMWQVSTGDGCLNAPQLIITVGGRSYPGCGTTGDGYAWMAALGHRIVPTRPALVPLLGGYEWSKSLSGLTLDDVELSVVPSAGKRKRLDQRRSSLLFTHFGFSGPAAMDVSRTITAASPMTDVQLILDPLPDVPFTDLESWLAECRRVAGKQQIANILSERIPRRLAEALLVHAGAPVDTKISELAASPQRKLLESLRGVALPITGTRGFDKAEVTAGGVDLRDVDPRTMSSRRQPGIFLAGELLDLDGWIGGYNFQSAFSTGYVAGESVPLGLNS